MTYLFSNNAATTLLNPIDNVATALTVVDATLFPASVTPDNPCKVTLQDADTGEIEICDCTNVSGNVLTVIRGRESTAAIAFSTGALVHHRLTAENLSNFVQDLENVGTGEGEIARDRVGAAANFKTLKQGLNVTIGNGANEITVDAVNTASGANLGSTPSRQGIYVNNTGTQLNLKSLVGGTDIEFVATAEEITANYTGTGGASDPGNIPTGVYTGGVVTLNANNTSVDVTAGSGVIVDAYTNPDAPVYTAVSWDNVNVPIYPDLASADDSTILSVQANGTFTERGGGIDDSTPNRTVIDLAVIKTVGGVITSIVPFKSVINTNHHAFFDYYEARESTFFLNGDHKQYLTPQSGLRLHFNAGFSDGFFFSLNARFDQVSANPHLLARVINGGTSFEVTYWKYVDYNGNITGPNLDLDPANYDIGLGVQPVPGPAGAATIQYIWHAPNEGDIIEYAQKYYDTIDEASKAVAYYIDSIDRDASNVLRGWILVGAIVFWKGATDCLNTNHARVYVYRNGIFNAPFISASVSDDPAPILSGNLDLNGYQIHITNSSDGLEGAIGLAQNDIDVFFGHTNIDGGYNSADGSILCQPGILSLGGSVVDIPALKGAEPRDVQVSEDGILYAAPLPDPGWEVSETSTHNHDFGNGKTQGPWVEVVGLSINPGDDIATGERVDFYVELYVENTEDKSGTIEVGVGINGADPTVAGANKIVGPDAISYIPVAWQLIAGADYTTADTFTVFARRAASQDDAHLYLRGTTQPHAVIASIPGSGGGGGGSPTNLGNTPGPSTVTITSSTGADTVVAGAVSGTAGVMTGAQVDSLAAKVDNGANVGTGEATIFRDKTTTNLNFKRLQQGANITLTNNADEIVIAASGGGGGSSLTLPVKVKTGTIVVGGSGVAVVGWDATSGRPLVQGADLISAVGMPVIGFALATHAADEEFDLPIYGEFDYDTSGWAEGDRLYQANLGAVVTSPPNSDGDPNQEIARVLTSSVTGKLFVYPDNHGIYIDWAAATISEPVDDNYGYLREGGATPSWVRGARVFEAASAPAGRSVGDFVFIT